MFKQTHLVNNCRASPKEKHILTYLTCWCVSTPLVYIHPKEMKGCANIAFVIITKNCEQSLLTNTMQILTLWSRAQQLKGQETGDCSKSVHSTESPHTVLQTLWFYLMSSWKLQNHRSKVKSVVRNRMQQLNTNGMKQCFNDQQFHSGL